MQQTPTQDAASTRAGGTRHASPWRVLTGAVRGFFDDRVMNLAASLSFYTLLSFAPLLVLLVWLAALLGYDARDAIVDNIGQIVGADAQTAARTVFRSANASPQFGSVAGLVSLGVSLVAATTVFAQLQMALNRIWGINARPRHAVFGWLRSRVLSMGVIFAVIFVLVVSLMVSSVLGLFLSQGGQYWDIINQLLTAGVLAFLFAVLFRYLPDGRLPWRRVVRGGIVTAILFAVGKWLIGYYLASGNVGSAYGAAGSLVVLLVWVYYSSAIFFFGAEVVRAWAVESGELVQPEAYAEAATGSEPEGPAHAPAHEPPRPEVDTETRR